MELFNIKKHLKNKANKVLEDYGFSVAKIQNTLLSFCYENTTEIIDKALFNSLSNEPLFSGKIDNVENVTMAKIFRDRILSFEEKNYNNRFNNIEVNNSEEFKCVLQGHYLINLFKEDFITLDSKKYGFTSSEEMFFVLGAEIANLNKIKDSREILVEHEDTENYKDIVSFYGNNIHGDFRIFMYDVSQVSMTSPFEPEETLPFGLSKLLSSVLGYHSLEHAFLITLLSLAYKQKVKLKSIDNFTEMINELHEERQIFGSYLDVDNYSKSINISAFAGLEYGYIPNIPMENHGTYNTSIENNTLVFKADDPEKVPMVIYPEMIDELILGLFKKVNKGNGRSSTKELTDCVLWFSENYYNHY